MQAKKYLIVVGGPTASGKTSTAIALARHFDTAVLSADSRQFFRELSIGTAKPTAQELAQVPHYFIDSHSVTQAYSVGAYAREALALLEQLYCDHELVILAGGSGLYINALCQGLDEFPPVPADVRCFFEEKLEREGIAALQQALLQVDPAYAKTVDLQNPHRLIRALSVQRISGQPFSSFRKKAQSVRSFTPIYLQMDWERDQLYERINRRVDLMIAAGLQAEVESLRKYQGHSALATVGYQEWWDYFEGKADQPTVIERIKQNSRRYAKRQLTWMRRDGFWKHCSPRDPEGIINYIQWRLRTGYELQTSRQDGVQQLSYQEQGQMAAQLELTMTQKYAFAKVQQAKDQQALESLLEEFDKRAGKRPQFLILPESVELSARKLGFQHTNNQHKIPAPVLPKIKSGHSLLYKDRKK